MCSWPLRAQLVQVQPSSGGGGLDATPTPKSGAKSSSNRIKITKKLIPPFALPLWLRVFIPALERGAGALTNPWLDGENDEVILLDLIAGIAKTIWPKVTYKVTFNSGLYLVVSSHFSFDPRALCSSCIFSRRGNASTSGGDVSKPSLTRLSINTGVRMSNFRNMTNVGSSRDGRLDQRRVCIGRRLL